jgi:hypothetical protein
MTKTKTSKKVQATNLVDRLPDNTEYFFLDFKEKQPETNWIRMPFLTWNQVMQVLNFRNAYDAHLRRQSKKESLADFKGCEWVNIRIQRETDLDVITDFRTLRQELFGTLYQATADLVRSGELKVSDLHKGFPPIG